MSRRRATLWPSNRKDAGRLKVWHGRMCGRPGIVGRVSNKVWRMATAEQSKAKRLARTAAGICHDCGILPAARLGRCETCNSKRQRNDQTLKVSLRIDGKCCNCKMHNTRAGQVLCETCADATVQRNRLKRKKDKLALYVYFGSKCNKCNEADIRCMHIHHKLYDGSEDRRGLKNSVTLRSKLVKQLQQTNTLPDSYEMLCANCHAKEDLKPWWWNDDSSGIS